MEVVQARRRQWVVSASIQMAADCSTHHSRCQRSHRKSASEEGAQATSGRWSSLGREEKAEAEMVTSIVVTRGNGHDDKKCPYLVRKDGASVASEHLFCGPWLR